MNQEETYILAEYSSLRSEIQSLQQLRLQVFGFCVAIIGTIISFALKSGENELNVYFYAFPEIFCLLIIFAALLMTINLTQNINRIGSYIRNVLESDKNGLRWETASHRERTKPIKNKSIIRMTRGFSKPLSLTYSLFSVSILLLIICKIQCSFPAMIGISLTGINLFFALTLYTQKFIKGFEFCWSYKGKSS